MKSVKRILQWISVGLFLQPFAFVFAQVPELSLLQAMKEAEKASPRLKSAGLRVEASSEQIRTAQSGYLPNLDVAVSAQNGNVGSFALLGVGSDFSATNRIGQGGSLILKQTIWDFGRTGSAVDFARSERDLRFKEQDLLRADVDLELLKTYLDCSFLRSEMRDASFTAQQAKVIAMETNRFVLSGQRSIIERYLVDAQTKAAETQVAELAERIKVVEQRLAIELGRPVDQSVVCADLTGRDEEIAVIERVRGVNPVLEVGQAETQAAQHRLDQAKSEQMPYVVGLVEGGYFNNDQLKNNWNYAVGVGVAMPLFSGFRIDSQIGKSRAEAQAQEASFDYSRELVETSNSRYDEQIRATQVRLDFLNREDKLANDAFDLAKKRYFSFQGTMVDLREALRNLDRVRISIEETRRDLLVARGGRALFNGSKPQ